MQTTSEKNIEAILEILECFFRHQGAIKFDIRDCIIGKIRDLNEHHQTDEGRQKSTAIANIANIANKIDSEGDYFRRGSFDS